jgi:diadenosine tetraphosphate (Ap4A) HIT family hydrolase
MTGVVCPLCVPSRVDATLWRDAQCRVIDVGDRDYPGYCRVIWNAHVREMSDLEPDQRTHLVTVIHGVELALRALLHPDKINLASLGNQTPHLHWHVIPRFVDDPHFPDSIWSDRKRDGRGRSVDSGALVQELVRRLATTEGA